MVISILVTLVYFCFFIAIVVAVWLKKPGLGLILAVALAVRLVALAVHLFVFPLPESQSDALLFEQRAWELAQGGTSGILSNFQGFDSYFISWIYSWIYLVFGRDVIFLHFLNISLGVGSVWLCWHLASTFYGSRGAASAAWLCALFPTLILYSVVTLREAFICFSLLIGLIGVVKWLRYYRWSYLLLVLFGFLFATFFHGALIVGLFVFLGLIFIQLISHFRGAFISGHIRLGWVAIFATAFLFVAFMPDIQIPKIGAFFGNSSSDLLIESLGRRFNSNAGAAFPSWLEITSVDDIISKGPMRMLYFLFGPFIWDVSSTSLLASFFDGSVSLLLCIGILYNLRGYPQRDSAVLGVVVILLVYFLVFGLVADNFGTSYRHRAKFLPILIALYFGTKRKNRNIFSSFTRTFIP